MFVGKFHKQKCYQRVKRKSPAVRNQQTKTTNLAALLENHLSNITAASEVLSEQSRTVTEIKRGWLDTKSRAKKYLSKAKRSTMSYCRVYGG